MEPGGTIEDELQAMARSVGELRPDEPMRPTLRDFADRVAGRCARIGDLYGDWDRNAGDHIRAVMHELPGLVHNKPAEGDTPCG